MARKKPRPPHSAAPDDALPAQGTTAVAEPPAGAVTDFAARVQVVVSPVSVDATPERFPQTTASRPLRRLCRACASLQLAITLLSLFAACLALATLLESAYSARIAQDLVYRTWWFTLLLGLLAVNVLCAALKKFPWKRHQAGFLITHCGLLVLLGGGLLTALDGTDGQMILIDTPDPAVHRRLGLTNRSHTIGFGDLQRLQVYHLRPPADEKAPRFQALLTAIDRGAEPGADAQEYLKGQWALPLQPGPFAWYDDDHATSDLPWHLSLLHRLAVPAPAFERPLGENGSLTVLNYYPHTEHWPFKRAAGGKGYPVLRLRLTSPMLGRPMERWVSLPTPDRAESSPMALETLVLNDAAMLPEFLDPPAPADMGPEGQIVLLVDGEKYRVPVHKDRVGKPAPLPGARQVTLLEYRPNFFEKDRPEPAQPAVRFELSGPYGKTEFSALARLPHLAEGRGPEAGRVALWYHFPDFRWGSGQLMGAVQFLGAPDSKVYYRVYGKDGLRQKGREIDPRDRDRLYPLPWKPMDLSFQVTEYLPHAVQEDSFAVRSLRPGAEPPPRLRPTVRGRLSASGKSAEFWVRQTGTPAWVDVGAEAFVVRYQSEVRPVDFELTLKRARKTTDPNSNRPAGFQSDVVLSQGRSGDGAATEHTISMNQPLRHGPYAVYQSNYEPMTDPRTHQAVLDGDGKLVSLSGLTVAHDPGLWLKYLGSSLVVLGIAAMFFMRAYFFRRPTPAMEHG